MSKIINRFSLILMLSLVAVVALVGCGSDKGATSKFINIGTGGTAGTYYPLGAAMAEILNKNIEGMNASAQSTGASVANINMLKDGSLDIAFVQNDIAYYAANGIEMFQDKKVGNLRGLASLYPETIQMITLAKNGITSVDQLRGKRVAVGAAGSGTEANARQILEAYGITYDDIKVQYLSFGEASGALKDGNVDAAFVTAGFPTAAIQDISVSNEVVLLSVGEEQQKALIEKYPFYTNAIIPAGTYSGVDTDTSTIAVMAMLVVSDEIDDKMGYDLVKAIFTNLDRVQISHAAGKMITLDSATEAMPIEMNAGAEKFFKEQ